MAAEMGMKAKDKPRVIRHLMATNNERQARLPMQRKRSAGQQPRSPIPPTYSRPTYSCPPALTAHSSVGDRNESTPDSPQSVSTGTPSSPAKVEPPPTERRRDRRTT